MRIFKTYASKASNDKILQNILRVGRDSWFYSITAKLQKGYKKESRRPFFDIKSKVNATFDGLFVIAVLALKGCKQYQLIS